MKRKIQVIPSGIPLVDNVWGGFYPGGTYLLIGQHKSGRTLLGIQYAKECVLQKEVCLYFTTTRPKDLTISAASIDFDLQRYMDQNLVVVIRVSAPFDDSENKDKNMAEYFSDLTSLIEQYQPSKIIFDEFTPFVEFDNINYLKEVFLQTIETIEENETTSLFILSEPVTSKAKNIVNAISSAVTGTIYLQKEDNESGKIGGVITITPNVGHIEGEFSSNYFIEPNKGFSAALFENTLAAESEIKKKEVTYKNLSDLNLPREDFFFYNVYSFDEFNLFLENQIAVFKTTGKKFSVVSIKMDKKAEEQGILNLDQLKNSVRLSIDKKDKITSIENNILVLISNIEEDSLNILLSRIKSNLPVKPEFLENVMKLISVFHITVDEEIENADDVINKLLLNGKKQKNIIRFT